MNSAVVVWPLFNSLQAFWPGLQVILVILLPLMLSIVVEGICIGFP